MVGLICAAIVTLDRALLLGCADNGQAPTCMNIVPSEEQTQSVSPEQQSYQASAQHGQQDSGVQPHLNPNATSFQPSTCKINLSRLVDLFNTETTQNTLSALAVPSILFGSSAMRGGVTARHCKELSCFGTRRCHGKGTV